MGTERGKSLVFVVTVYTALVIAFGMALYGVYQYLAVPERAVVGLMLEHGWHVLVFGGLIYLCLSLVLYRNVVRPVQQLNVKLYAITKGDIRPLSVESNVREVQEITQVVNFLLSRINKAVTHISIAELGRSSERLRAIARGPGSLDDAAKNALMEIASNIDGAVNALSVDSLLKREEPKRSIAPE